PFAVQSTPWWVCMTIASCKPCAAAKRERKDCPHHQAWNGANCHLGDCNAPFPMQINQYD
ncbi:MAG: hypothetical protein Q9M30_02680, partial [Mariprofundaceae bacterium]|nr:hypothetical protein [Mariprofundaceae bacterium]